MDTLADYANIIAVALLGLIVLYYLRDRFDTLTKDMDRRFELVDRRFEQVDRRFEQVDRRVDRLEEAVSALRSDVSALRSDVTRIALAVGAQPRSDAG